MGYAQRSAIAGLIASVLCISVYTVVVVIPGPNSGIDWFWGMLWMIGAGVALTVILSTLLAVIAGARREHDGITQDERDEHISHVSDRVGHAFLVIGACAAIVLCAVRADVFWIAHAIFFGFAVSALISGVSRVLIYGRGRA